MAATELYSNFARSTLASAITTGSTSLPLAAGTGALFPNPTGGDYFRVVVDDGVQDPEIITCTARTTDSLSTIFRAQEGTTAKAFSAGTIVEIRITAGTLQLFRGSSLYLTGGGFGSQVTYVNAAMSPYTVLESDSNVYADPVAGAITLNLPTAAGKMGREYKIIRVSAGANLVTIVPNGAETIIGQTSYVLRSIWESLVLNSSTAHWYPTASHFYESFQIWRVQANRTTTGVAATDVTDMSFAIQPNEVWIVRFALKVSCGTGGTRFAINAPSGATLVMQVYGGSTSTVTAFTSSQVTALNTLTTENYCVSTTRGVTIEATIVNSTTAGTVQLRFASLTNGQTSTVFANSSMNAQRLSA